MSRSSEGYGTYFGGAGSDEDEELMRLRIQDEVLTNGIGGVLPEQADVEVFERVLDVGCGTGGWLIEAARRYPSMKWLVGVDRSSRMVGYARKQAELAGVEDRVEFRVMDALKGLEFPEGCFDLVNERFGSSFLRTGDWHGFLQECQRVTRSGGVMRATECDLTENSSPALNRFYDLLLEAFYKAGHFFSLDRRSVIDELGNLLRREGVGDVQTREHRLVYHAGTVEWEGYAGNVRHGLRTLRPFFEKWSHPPDDYEGFVRQVLEEMEQPDFVATWTVVTAWGIR